jgi:hypothetical protein
MTTQAKSLEALLAALTVGGRLNQERSRARERRFYGDPARHVKFGKRDKGEDMDRQSDREKADTLLIEFHRWESQWRPKLGAPRIAPYSRQSVSSKQYDDPADLVHDKVYQKEMEAVEYCVDALALPLQQAIRTEMRNREVNAKVWRSPSNKTYTEALDAVLPVMRKRGLFD